MRNAFILIFGLFIICFSSCKNGTEKAKEKDVITTEAFHKSFTILNAIKGTNKDSIVTFLQNSNEVVLVTEGDQIITFNLKNGPTMIVELGEKSAAAKGISQSQIENNASSTPPYANVVGADSKDRNHKKALILAPHYWTFTENDDALVPLKALKDHRNYKGTITYKANEKESSRNISFEDYLNIGDYDLVHISTHGSRSGKRVKDSLEIIIGGDSNNTETYLYSGIYFDLKNPEPMKILIDSKGLWEHTAYTSGGEVALKSTFFKEKIKNLNDKIIIISACEQGQRKDLKSNFETHLINGQFFYWQNIVYPRDARKAFEILFERMVLYGETAPEAFDNIPINLKTFLKSYITVNDKKIETTTTLKMVSKGNAMHLIEPVTILDPRDKIELKDGSVYSFEGIFGDGKNEKATFAFEVIGYSIEEIQKNELTISLKVDGNYVQKNIEISNSEKVKVEKGKNDKSFIVTIKDFDLQKDLIKDKTVFIEAFFNLPGSNFGYHGCSVKTGISDMKIVISSKEGNSTIYFDADNYGIKMLNPADPSHDVFYDAKGFIYSFNPEEGWMKVNINNAMNMYSARVPNLKMENLNFPQKGTTYHYLVEYVNVLTIGKLENEPSAKKISGENDKRTKYRIEGLIVTYDEQNRLIEMDAGQGKILYYYEEQTVVFPPAKLMAIPSF